MSNEWAESHKSEAPRSLVVAVVEGHVGIDILALLEEGVVRHPHEQGLHVSVRQRSQESVREHGEELL